MKKCVFCSVVNGKDRPRHEIIWQNRKYMAFLDLKPRKDGHILVIPKKHTNSIFELNNKDYLELLKITRAIALQLKKHTKSRRVYLFIKGSQVPHVHVHLIPIKEKTEAGRLPRKETTKQELNEVANHLRKSWGIINQ